MRKFSVYFDLHVKQHLDEFYNYREELNSLIRAIKEQKLIVVSGLRRVGKTSLMRVAFNSYDGPKVFLDGRDFRTPHDLLNKGLLEIYAQVDPTKRIFDVLEAVDIGPFSIKLEKQKISLKEINDRLGDRRAVLFVDEVQESPGLDRLLARLYDYSDHIVVVISGSEVGLLQELFSPDKPLFGRLHTMVQLNPLSPEKSREFLRLGFAQEGKEYQEQEINEAVDELDGLVGWLTYYGYLRRKYPHREALDILRRNARLLLLSELERFLDRQRGDRRRYLLILRALKESRTWSEIKEFLEFKLGRAVSSSRLSVYLEQLIKHGFVLKNNGLYRLADPLLRVLTAA